MGRQKKECRDILKGQRDRGERKKRRETVGERERLKGGRGRGGEGVGKFMLKCKS